MKNRALSMAARLAVQGRIKDMGRPPVMDTEREAAALILEMQSRLESLEQEMQEQARIIGMGAERELALIAKVESLEKDAARWNMLPAVACDHYINLMSLYRDIDAAMQANKGD